ncbi:fungal-specific transcription factor domain-containing protein [Podospora didyma]|uniref:Fungal-specific transcription factor domain-containing protein n=1 Tax=Podospora didyma TaxID=330526 RepID=A0AAE0N364_9PEZI|nr:fungal-specific transcription factor domain-containing protein [Podospora didyma]
MDAESPTGTRQSGPSFQSGSRGGRVAVACQRCKRRKQRCDGVQPACRGCRKAGLQCVYERVIRPQYPGGKSLYISALEERIAFLEARMPEHGQDHLDNLNSNVPAATSSPPDAAHAVEVSEEEDSSLVDGVAYLSLCASGTTDAPPEPFYLGSSSGATIARMIQSSVFRSSKLSLSNHDPLLSSGQQDVLQPSPQPPSVSRPVSPLEERVQSEFPPLPQAKLLFDVFFDRLHTRWPILDRKLYYHYFEQQCDRGALPPVQRSIFHLIFAISSRFLQLTKKNQHVDPQQHFAAAIEPMDYILEQHNLATVQFLVLLAMHGQRSPYGAGAWSQVRYALTLCVELGFHRVRTMHAPSQTARDLEVRRRVFWACYCQDRTTSLLLGRTFGIADRDINVELPSQSPTFWDLTSSGQTPDSIPGTETRWSNMLPFIHIIKLRKLQSKIHRTVFRVDKDLFSPSSMHPSDRSKHDNKIAKICAELDEWVTQTPTPPRDATHITWMYDPDENAYHHDSRDFFTLQYHKTRLSLFTAILPTLMTSDPRFTSCAESASLVCTAYKRLNAQKTLSYTITALHSCFIAGLTLVYCLWRNPGLFSSGHGWEGVSACSLCLTIFGEKWPGAVKYRDTFDALSASLFKMIMDPTTRAVPGGDHRAATGPGTKLNMSGDGGSASDSTLDFNTQSHNAVNFSDRRITSYDGGRVSSNAILLPNSTVLGAMEGGLMEVDEDAPGGWQGWRLFNEMVTVQGQGGFLSANYAEGDTPIVWNGDNDGMNMAQSWNL